MVFGCVTVRVQGKGAFTAGDCREPGLSQIFSGALDKAALSAPFTIHVFYLLFLSYMPQDLTLRVVYYPYFPEIRVVRFFLMNL